MSQNFNLPIAPELEKAVLGALLLETKAMPRVSNLLRTEMFHEERHQHIFGAIKGMFTEGRAIDIITVTEELNRRKQLEAVGGPYYIAMLSGDVASSAHLEEHVLIMKEYFMRRELIKGLSQSLAMATDMSRDLMDVVCCVQEMLDGIGKDADWANSLRDMEQVMEDTIRMAAERREMQVDGMTGIPTGLKQMNQITPGWQKSELIVLAGRPGTGKTMVAMHSALTAAEAGYNVLFCSIEMQAEQLGDRSILLRSDVDPKAWRNGTVTTPDWMEGQHTASRLKGISMMIDDNPTMSIDYIRAEARTLKAKGKLDIVFIDYLQLSEMGSGEKWKKREELVREASRKAKLMAKELDCPVILLSQLNRESEQRVAKRPQISDLRESGAIEQDADMVVLLYRPAMHGITTDKESGFPTDGLGMAIVAKQRNGQTGTVYFGHNPTMTKIGDYIPPREWFERLKEKKDS